MFTRIWDLSGLSLSDRALLSASFYYQWDDRLNCEREIAVRRQRAKTPEQAALAEQAIRIRNGCNAVSAKPRLHIDGIGFHKCLCNYHHPLFYAYVELESRLEQGLLPDRGAYLDQPAQLMEALQLIRRLKAEVQQAEQAKQEKKGTPRGR